MSLKQDIEAARTVALKAQDAERLTTLRFLLAALTNKEIEKRGELSDDDARAVIKTLLKQVEDSRAQFEKGGRADLAANSAREAALYASYLPEQLDDAHLSSLVAEAISESGVTSIADMGRAMGAAMKKVGGQADGGRVRAEVERQLALS